MMQILFLFLTDIVKMLVFFVLRVAEAFAGCAVRLFYWSVRTYGWGRVAWFLSSAGISAWLYSQLFGHVSGGVVFIVVAAGTAGIYGAGLLVVRGVACGWYRKWLERLKPPGQEGPKSEGTIFSPAVTLPFPVPGASTGSGAHTGSLWERLLAPETIRQAWHRVLVRGGGPGTDGVTVEAFALDAASQLAELAAELREECYRPRPPRWVEVVKEGGGVRRLAVLAVRDRVVQQAAHLVLSPLWERRFSTCSYAYRPGRSALQAVAAVEEALSQGRHWVVDADIESFFDRVPHRRLFRLLEDWLPDEKLRWLVQVSVTSTSFQPELGLAQGAPLSPLLANVYLYDFDVLMLGSGYHLIRYSDDFLVPCATRLQAEEALRTVERLLRELGLGLKREKTRIVNLADGFTFLGYTFTPAGKRPSEKALASLRQRLSGATGETTRRQILAGWQGYFGEADASLLAANLTEVPGESSSRPATGPEEGGGWMEDFDPERIEDEPWWEVGIPGPDWEEYSRRFVGRSDVFGRFWSRDDGRHGYAPVRRPLTPEDLESHIQGEKVLATYLLHPDGTTRALVLDVDGPEEVEVRRGATFALAARLVAAFVERGIAPLWFATGGKGYHLWFCFDGPVPAKTARRWVQAWVEAFRPFPEGILVEIFPKQDQIAPGALGSLIRLPLGRHPKTGEWGQLLDLQGEVVADPWSYFKSVPLIGVSSLAPGSVDKPPLATGKAPPPPAGVAQLVDGCSLVRALIEKATETRRLRHTERLALLYVFGACGEAGRVYLHQVIACCDNYDPRITERWIQRLEEGRKPIRCATLQDWLRDHLTGFACDCQLRGRGHSPLQLLKKVKVKDHRTPKSMTPLPEEEWEKVAQDLFPEEPDEDVEKPDR
ncbi:hypothetical protein G7K71_13015 [Desulfofundulus sp. TPOSR]|uniref:reverse transcriptase domain-containing protein n=1 Tax=Desulfofundulus sp. TPOSR TaxID=2714340 RepID=UPI00140805BF|nr:reverse transcriptase domain-containing protein [Desulfofundulus sp. TPOSR]NHM27881.1 hypothetical protein [Desulfofundulus sp. TPOSR]